MTMWVLPVKGTVLVALAGSLVKTLLTPLLKL